MSLQAGSSRETIGNNIHEMLASGHPFNQALAASLHSAHVQRSLAHRDAGGMTPSTPGLFPNTATEQPQVQNMAQRFAALPPEQLQELIVRYGNSEIGAIAQKVLQVKRLAPQPSQSASVPMQARGGMIPHLANGGRSLSPLSDIPYVPTGVKQSVADYLANNGGPSTINTGTGTGTSNTGNSYLDTYLNDTQKKASYAPPSRYVPPPAPVVEDVKPIDDRALQAINEENMWRNTNISGGEARGGGMKAVDLDDVVPILAAGGEFVISPEHVMRLGDGDLKAGHRALDAWVVSTRKQIVEKMRSLKPPVKN